MESPIKTQVLPCQKDLKVLSEEYQICRSEMPIPVSVRLLICRNYKLTNRNQKKSSKIELANYVIEQADCHYYSLSLTKSNKFVHYLMENHLFQNNKT